MDKQIIQKITLFVFSISKTVAKKYKYTHLKKYRKLKMVIEQIISIGRKD